MNYHLRLLDDKLIVSSISYVSPLQDLHSIASDLKSKHYLGEVMFDLLCVNGASSNRFILIAFNGESFERRTTKPVQNPKASLVSIQDSFYKSNPQFLADSVLSKDNQVSYSYCH
ncbi:type II toxin-antitoxin system RnlB family antitoxin [Photobacterium phosphoreum]|uniref:type II toxin-antitoxin system RnlB family antitoxin n=1 Tax=Photobacterium phosphoreum TaxID=659 RepID=UPI001F86BA95|nr:hypothetical protein [Photobacterium phosphoreum]MCF2177859.1 hypothetical protein [Photobacterium phosphoreum]